MGQSQRRDSSLGRSGSPKYVSFLDTIRLPKGSFVQGGPKMAPSWETKKGRDSCYCSERLCGCYNTSGEDPGPVPNSAASESRISQTANELLSSRPSGISARVEQWGVLGFRRVLHLMPHRHLIWTRCFPVLRWETHLRCGLALWVRTGRSWGMWTWQGVG